jgi:phosphoenolpyruvate carboxykinase (ATP)
MSTQVERAHGLEALGIVRSGPVHWNLSPAVLYEIALRRNEAILAADGPLVARTGQHTGRSPQDKFTVKEPTTEQNIDWGLNKGISETNFDALHRDLMTYVQDKELYVLDAWGGADPAYRVPVRIVTEFAWHNLFARNMFIPEPSSRVHGHRLSALQGRSGPSRLAN